MSLKENTGMETVLVTNNAQLKLLFKSEYKSILFDVFIENGYTTHANEHKLYISFIFWRSLRKVKQIPQWKKILLKLWRKSYTLW